MSEKKELVMDREQAEAKLKEWGVLLGLDTGAGFFLEALENLSFIVMKGLLDFDPEAKTFTYRLFEPLERPSGTMELITIKEPYGLARTVLKNYFSGLTATDRKGLSLRDATCVAMVAGGFFWKCTGDELPKW
jgi:hypothetical protein